MALTEKTVLALSVIMAIAGLLFLLAYAQEIELKPVRQLQHQPADEKVVMKGTINKLKAQGKVTFLELQGERIETADIIVFPPEELFLQPGDYVEVDGTVEDYKGEKEIIASRIVKR